MGKALGRQLSERRTCLHSGKQMLCFSGDFEQQQTERAKRSCKQKEVTSQGRSASVNPEDTRWWQPQWRPADNAISLRATNRRARICSFLLNSYCVSGIAKHDRVPSRTDMMTTVSEGYIDECQATWATQPPSQVDRTWRNTAEASLSRMPCTYSPTPLWLTCFLIPKSSLLLWEEIGITNNIYKHRGLPFYDIKFLVTTTGSNGKNYMTGYETGWELTNYKMWHFK